ncbi:DNA repair protein RecN [Fodinicola acaciae]|uniref:DNA repair protein RecN n=1 Tax=Fodinicola acaciae TaxID=2681555 RepID=UPI0013D02FAB|nr:DNA repair protein RecN [Fodinicola acaciae]
MLEEVRISGLGVIDDAELHLSDGLTVVTGETGAGKTMVVTALDLLFGGRADAGRVRTGAERALVEGRLSLNKRTKFGKRILARAEEAGGEADDDGSLVLSRSVSPEGRSRAHLGGRSVPAAVLSDIGELAVTVHGQMDQVRLLRPAEQRAALDSYGGAEISELLEAHRDAFRRWREAAADLADRTARAGELAEQAEYLRIGLAAVEQLDPQPGEDAELKTEAQRLEHADALRTAALTAHQALAGDPTAATLDAVDVTSLLDAARRALAAAAGDDPELAALATRTDELAALVGELSTDLSAYADGIEGDPARLDWIQERRARLATVARRYVNGPDELPEWAEQARLKLEGLDSSDEALAALAAEVEKLRLEVTDNAVRLSAARVAVADEFGSAVTTELGGLAMPHARVTANVWTVDARADGPSIVVDDREVAVGPDGIDEIEICLQPHPGSPPLPLQKGASGGELSRVMLAVEVVLAGGGSTATLVFDEVDAGVGGKAAVEVGARLARLARSHQVLVVTHLPQVAAFADRHLMVDKDSGGSVTTSSVRWLDDEGRARELARMLAGMEDSMLGMAHATELLEKAQATKDAGFKQPRRKRTKK